MSSKIVSLTNKVWKIQSEKKEHEGAADLIATLAENRGIKNLDDFLNISLKTSRPDPFVFIDMKKAAQRIVESIKSGQKIAILGDYDVDGVASTSVLVNFFSHIGVDFSYSIPNRVEEGYGLNIENIAKHKDCLIIAVDCGSNAIEELAYAKNHGIDIIVVDHHKMSTIPDLIALVNPHRPDESGNYKYLCATGLAFMCVDGVNQLLRASDFYQNRKEPDLTDYLDLVALATVCDVVDLVGLNRSFVSAGIEIIRQRKNLGIDALMSFYKGFEITSETLSFFFGPRLNAAGRVSSADLSVKLLTTKNPIEAQKIAQQLENLNKERQIIEHEIMEEAIVSVDENLNFICLYNQNWHAGVMGIVAGRLKEKYNKPSIIISGDINGKSRASCRSIDCIDMSEIIRKGIQRGIINSGGGHAMAAGFSIEINKISDLMEFLKTEIHCDVISQELRADCFLNLSMLSIDLVKSILVLEPFGAGNRRPKFVIPNVRITSPRVVGANHISAILKDENGNSVRMISFKSLDTELGHILLNENKSINALGTCVISFWRGEKYVNFQLEDVSDYASD